MTQTLILQILRSSDDFISGESISRQLKISRAGIWKNIQELKKDGYDITAMPNHGYKFLSSPDRLSEVEIKHDLNTTSFGQVIEYHESVSSTMDVAFKLGVEGSPEGMLVCAETQTKGRGRMGRAWVSPKGKGIYVSLLLRPNLATADVAKLTIVGAVAVAEALRNETDLAVAIKWPNDLLIEGKKVAGFLTQLSAETDRVNFVVLGFGINVNTPPGALPDHATSLKLNAKKTFSRVALLKEILISLEHWYELFQRKGFGPVIHRWKELSVTLGQKVLISDDGTSVRGTAIDLDPSGALVIRTDQGQTIKRMSGDVTHL